MTHFKLNEFLLRMNKKGLRFQQILFMNVLWKKLFFDSVTKLSSPDQQQEQNGFEQEEGPHAEPHHPVGPAGAGGTGVQHPWVLLRLSDNGLEADLQ